MVQQTLAPSASETQQHGDTVTRYDHPAFGNVVLTHPTGVGTLFGSDVQNHGSMRISVHRAHMERRLNRDWIGSDALICEFELSAAQFAQFITSQGSGSGTPCTLRYGSSVGAKLESYPAIDKVETKGDVLRREVKESAKKEIDKVRESLDKVKSLMEGGGGKKELRAALFHLQCMIDNMPSNMDYAVRSAEEALEHAVSAAKIEVESFVSMTTQRLGVESLEGLRLARTSPKAISDQS